MAETYIETNSCVLKQLYTELRKIILETKIVEESNDQIATALSNVFCGPGGYDRINLLLQLPIRFDGPTRKVHKRNYYVVKNRLTKFTDTTYENEVRAGYMYVLVAKSNNVSVASFYAHEGEDLSNLAGTRFKWVNWKREKETDCAWIIYDHSGHVRAHVAGNMMDGDDYFTSGEVDDDDEE